MLLISTYKGFITKLTEAFSIINKDKIVERELRRIRQQTSITKYVIQFQLLTSRVNFGDQALKGEFYRGLKEEIKDELQRHPKPTTLSKLQTIVRTIDERMFERRQEKKGA